MLDCLQKRCSKILFALTLSAVAGWASKASKDHNALSMDLQNLISALQDSISTQFSSAVMNCAAMLSVKCWTDCSQDIFSGHPLSPDDTGQDIPVQSGAVTLFTVTSQLR